MTDATRSQIERQLQGIRGEKLQIVEGYEDQHKLARLILLCMVDNQSADSRVSGFEQEKNFILLPYRRNLYVPRYFLADTILNRFVGVDLQPLIPLEIILPEWAIIMLPVNEYGHFSLLYRYTIVGKQMKLSLMTVTTGSRNLASVVLTQEEFGYRVDQQKILDSATPQTIYYLNILLLSLFFSSVGLESESNSSSKFGSKRVSSTTLSQPKAPIFIGERSTIKKSYSKTAGGNQRKGGKVRSRRGYVRVQRYGKGNRKRKLVYIKPITTT